MANLKIPPRHGLTHLADRVALDALVMPRRIQLRRAKGWRMPENTIKVDRSTHLGNPFIVGKHGTVKECIDLFNYLLAGYQCFSVDRECVDRQRRFVQYFQMHRTELKGKNLACWCKDKQPCHADILLKILNAGGA